MIRKVVYLNGRKRRQQAGNALQRGSETGSEVAATAEGLMAEERQPTCGTYDLVW